jgi:enterobacterial common antigen flippase
LRRVGDLARINVCGAVAGTVVGIPIVWYWGESGIVPFLIWVAFSSLLVSWWISRRSSFAAVTLPRTEIFSEARALIGFGAAIMLSALMTAAVAYLSRLILIHELGLVSVGHYIAAYTVSGIYVGFILQGLGTDYYPRLTGVANDNIAVNRLVNEQATVSLLLAVPGILATLSVAPLVVHIFYSGDFDPAVSVLRWQMLGVFGRVASWPMSYVILAKAQTRLFLGSEILASIMHLLLVYFGVRLLGLTGAGVALAGLYLWYWIFVYYAVRRLTGFRWTTAYIRLSRIMSGGTVLTFLATEYMSSNWGMGCGMLLSVGAGWHSVRCLQRLTGGTQAGAFCRRIMARFSRKTRADS